MTVCIKKHIHRSENELYLSITTTYFNINEIFGYT